MLVLAVLMFASGFTLRVAWKSSNEPAEAQSVAKSDRYEQAQSVYDRDPSNAHNFNGRWRMSHGKLDPDTPIPGCVGGQTLGNVWAWGYSNILTNNLRGVFAEFLVGTALGIVGDSQRVEWDSYDLGYEGQGIEVKSSAYLQSWPQPRPSKISWNIAEHFIYEEETDTWREEKERPAKCYVLCLYCERKDRNPPVMLDLDKWRFYVVPTSLINDEFGAQKTVVLSRIEPLAAAVKYGRLRGSVGRALGGG
jgi:hypothetical protein